MWTSDTTDFLQLATALEQNGLFHESRSILARWWSFENAPKSEAASVSNEGGDGGGGGGGGSKLSALLNKVREAKQVDKPTMPKKPCSYANANSRRARICAF